MRFHLDFMPKLATAFRAAQPAEACPEKNAIGDPLLPVRASPLLSPCNINVIMHIVFHRLWKILRHPIRFPAFSLHFCLNGLHLGTACNRCGSICVFGTGGVRQPQCEKERFL